MTEKLGELAAALAAVQAKMPHVGKDNRAQIKSDKGNYAYFYADLTEISEALLPLLAAQKLAWTTLPTLNDAGVFVLRYALRHSSGESIGGDYPLPAASSTPQVLGSAITYARRYALCAVTGLAPGGEDDDAGAAQDARNRQDQDAAAPPAPVVPSLPKGIASLARVNSLEALDNFRAMAAGYAADGLWSADMLAEFDRAAESARIRLEQVPA